MKLEELHATYGPVALITGASSGIGQQFAEILAGCGFDLVLVARRKEKLLFLSEQLKEKYSTTSTVIEADLSEPEAPQQITQHCHDLDIGLLVSNAGFGLKGPHQENDPQRMADMLMVNCHAPMQLTHQLIPKLLARNTAGIIFTSSVEGLMGFPNSASYAATKAFVNSLAEGLWGELSAQGVDVCAACPSSTDTPALDLQGVDRSKVGEMMSPNQVASLALENIRNGPVYIVGKENEEMFTALAQMPRRESLPMMGDMMKQTLLNSCLPI